MTEADLLSELTAEQAQRLQVLEGRPAGTLLVHEIYASIQGESTYAGLACTFVRLAGCHLRCTWCDTPHAFSEGAPMTIDEISERAGALAPRLVELTGGEPLAHPEALSLLTRLADDGHKVLLETSGSLAVDAVDPRVTIIMDLKCPGSGEESANRYENLATLKPEDEIKFVLAGRADFDWAVSTIARYRLTGCPLLFSPVFGNLDYQVLAEWIIESGLPVRLQMQLHKHIWPTNARGV